MPNFSTQAGSERDPLEISDGIDRELSDDDRDELINRLNEAREKNEADGLINQEITQESRKSVKALLNEAEGAGRLGELSNPENQAQIAAETLMAEGEEPLKIIKKGFTKLGEGLQPEEKEALFAKLIQEEKIANEAINQKDNPQKGWSKKKCAAVFIGVLGALGLTAILILEFATKNKKTNQTQAAAKDKGLEFDAIGDDPTEASQTFVSLLMQAASDAAYNALAFKDFGISESTYQSLRAQLLAQRDNVSEEAYWQIMAQQAETIFPPSGKAYTLGDHMLALQIQFNLLEPLYDSQPLDLDLDDTISALAEHIDLNAEIPIQKLCTNLIEVVPESSGANRLQRLVLARMAIARAIAKTQPSV